MGKNTPDAAGWGADVLVGRTAIVTGAAGGLGVSICERMRSAGAKVLPVDLTGDGVFKGDISTPQGNAAAVAEALGQFGRLDTLVLNAGVQHVAPIATFPEDQWDRLMDVMVKGPFLMMQAAWSALTERPGGRIIVTGSTSGHVAEANKAAYVTAKHGVLGLVKVAAIEGAPHGLTVNAVAPGWMLTPLAESQIREQAAAQQIDRAAIVRSMLAGQPTERFVDPSEVADVIVFLASAHASALTGISLPVDLGALAV